MQHAMDNALAADPSDCNLCMLYASHDTYLS